MMDADTQREFLKETMTEFRASDREGLKERYPELQATGKLPPIPDGFQLPPLPPGFGAGALGYPTIARTLTKDRLRPFYEAGIRLSWIAPSPPSRSQARR